MKWWAREYVLLVASLVIAIAIVFWGGLREKETTDIIALVTNLSVTMAGFGLVAFQIARVSNELKNDFIESSILMILSTLSGFFYLVYPERSFFMFNFGEISIFTFFWAFILFLIILIDKRFNILK
jgi:hypothetical protein